MLHKMYEEGICEVPGLRRGVYCTTMSIHDVRHNEPTHRLCPCADNIHVAFVSRQKPGHEVDGITLIYLPEDSVESTNHFDTGGIVVGKACAAQVMCEHVEASGLDQGFHLVFTCSFRGTCQFSKELDYLSTANFVQVAVMCGSEAWGAVQAGDFPSGLLEIGPVAQCQSCKVTRLQSTCPHKDTCFGVKLGTVIYEWVEAEPLDIAASNGNFMLMTDAYGNRAPREKDI